MYRRRTATSFRLGLRGVYTPYCTYLGMMIFSMKICLLKCGFGLSKISSGMASDFPVAKSSFHVAMEKKLER